ncbi:sigma-54-dependent transcriptional regulator [Candidatus Korobacter versatilis]|uniref:sigma-54-dependent transcriptional regulator n=1 Tax=Candidatus Korobacter versatilis TaxID=658062 RepID=UPI001E4F70C7|nr:sigma-54 dependent transcriptional regulator [Candidatus Koribacter versatilis]
MLLVEDQEALRLAVREYLTARGFDVVEAATCDQARRVFADTHPTAAVLDYHLPDGTALDLLPEFKRSDPFVPLIILTAFGSIDLAVGAIKAGADQFLTKPVELAALTVVIQRAIEARRDRQKQLAGRPRQEREAVDPFLGSSAQIRKLEEQARRLLEVDTPVLIQGETGAGKTLLARWIHANSRRSDEAFVDLNCAGLSRELLETELFGHEKGAFTGAIANKTGLFEVAHRGTVFLDEIGDVDPQIQPKLLKVLEDKQFRRLGDVRDRKVDVRLLAATHQELSALVRERKFRSDLYFRISTIPLNVPPLRERTEDIPVLAEKLLQTSTAELGKSGFTLKGDAMDAMQRYAWPGNIRELKNVIERAVLLSGSRELSRRDLMFEPQAEGFEGWTTEGSLTLEQLERKYIEWTLQQSGGKVVEAAKRLDIPKSTLYQKLKQFKIEGGSAEE